MCEDETLIPNFRRLSLVLLYSLDQLQQTYKRKFTGVWDKRNFVFFLQIICLKHLRPPGITRVNEKMDEEVVIVLVLDEEMVEDVKVVLAVKTRVVVLIPL